MVLKDSGGLVKLYAMVNVEQYNIVATGTTQDEAKANYLARLETEGILAPEAKPEPPAPDVFTLTLDAITPVTANGETLLYLRGKTDEGKTRLVKASIAQNERVLFLSVGDTVSVSAYPTETADVYTLVSFTNP
jgi:hypothetical protein